jgi:hypothetical protein
LAHRSRLAPELEMAVMVMVREPVPVTSAPVIGT